MREQHQKSAGDRQILLEMQELIAIAELGVEQDAAAMQKPASSSAANARLVADQHQQAAAELDRDRERQQMPGTPNALI